MGTRLTQNAYSKLIEENIAWLMKLPRTLERDHTIHVLKDSVEKEYAQKNYSGYFLTAEDSKKVSEWQDKHNREKHMDMAMGEHEGRVMLYTGAIGGSLTLEFTPTSLGIITKVVCFCKEEFDFTDYDGF